MAVKVNVIGRLGVDAEVKEGKNGKFVTFRMATDGFKDKDGQKETIWLSVMDSSQNALKRAEWLKKGKLVDISGVEVCRIYNDKNGQPQIGREVIADRVDFVNVGVSGNTSSDATTTAANIPTSCGTLKPPTPQPSMSMSSIVDDDELPF